MELNDKTAYIIISEYKGACIPNISFGGKCSEKGIITLYYKGRVRNLKIAELLEVNDCAFEFVDKQC